MIDVKSISTEKRLWCVPDDLVHGRSKLIQVLPQPVLTEIHYAMWHHQASIVWYGLKDCLLTTNGILNMLLKENVNIVIEIPVGLCFCVPRDNKSALDQVVACCWTGDEPSY